MRTKVLLVDDEQEFVELIEYKLNQEGFDTYTASNGVEALHLARRLLPDVILLDLMLPDIDGASVCEILRSQPSTAGVPVIVVSALDGMVTRNRSTEVGISGFFKKPVDLKALADRIRTLSAEQEELIKRRLVTDDGQ